MCGKFVRVMPSEYRRVLLSMTAEQAAVADTQPVKVAA
jgi:hypothetical protein